MKKLKLFFVTVWALLFTFTVQAHAKAVEGDIDNGATTGKSRPSHALSPDEARLKLMHAFIKYDLYNLENAFLQVENLSDEQVALLLTVANSPQLKEMVNNAHSHQICSNKSCNAPVEN